MDTNLDKIAADVVECAFRIHRLYGPGLLEKAYEKMLVRLLRKLGHKVDEQKPVSIVFEGETIDEAFRIDLLVDDGLVVELKATDEQSKVFYRQLLTYLKLTDKRLGLVINFGMERLAEGIKRVAN